MPVAEVVVSAEVEEEVWEVGQQQRPLPRALPSEALASASEASLLPLCCFCAGIAARWPPRLLLLLLLQVNKRRRQQQKLRLP